MEPITLENFATLVKQMRDAQKDYFKYKNPSALNKSKLLEGRVDEMIKRMELKDDSVVQTKLL